MTIEIMKVSWVAYETGVKNLVEQIQKSKLDLKYITGVPRGGLPLAVSLSHALDLQFIDFAPYPGVVPPRTLVCDDICDTGRTLCDSMNLFNAKNIQGMRAPTKNIVFSAALFYRANKLYQPDFFGFKLNHKKWLQFPWELK